MRLDNGGMGLYYGGTRLRLDISRK